MARKQTPKPMETQPVTNWGNSGAPMGQSPSKRLRTARTAQPAVPAAEAEAKRRRSLRNQRGQLEAIANLPRGQRSAKG